MAIFQLFVTFSDSFIFKIVPYNSGPLAHSPDLHSVHFVFGIM